MWSQLSQCSQLSQSTTIVATPITIVAKNHNCRNCNHNCRNLINHKCRNSNHNCRNFFEKSFSLVNVYTWFKDDVSFSIIYLDCTFHNIGHYLAPLTCHNIIFWVKSGHFWAKPVASSQFVLFLWQRETFQKWNLPINWRKTCSRVLQLGMLLTVVLHIYAKKYNNHYIQMNKYACAGN